MGAMAIAKHPSSVSTDDVTFIVEPSRTLCFPFRITESDLIKLILLLALPLLSNRAWIS